MFDVLIIGAGPSGMSAALYALRAGKKVLVLERETIGGQISSSPRLENYPSIPSISGLDFSNNLFDQIMCLGAEFEMEDVLEISKENNVFKVKTNYATHEALSVIIANGCKHRKINVPGEDELLGKGVSYCAVCDGAFFKDEEVSLIGDANTALQYSILLSDICKSVHVFTLFDKFFADDILVSRLKNLKNVTIRHNVSLTSINGKDQVESLDFIDTKTNEKFNHKTKACFICIGQVPDNERFNNLVDLDKGYIVTDDNMETKTPGLYACGDTRKKLVRQVITATSDGAIAATSALNYINRI